MGQSPILCPIVLLIAGRLVQQIDSVLHSDKDLSSARSTDEIRFTGLALLLAKRLPARWAWNRGCCVLHTYDLIRQGGKGQRTSAVQGVCTADVRLD